MEGRGGKRKTRKKKGGERPPVRQLSLHNPNNIDEAVVFVGDIPPNNPDDSDSDDDPPPWADDGRPDEDFFENNLYYVINMCLSEAFDIGNEAINNLTDDDGSLMSHDEDNILTMNDEELANTAANACNALVFGNYHTGHLGILQQSRDAGTLSRLSEEDKRRIHETAIRQVGEWFSQQRETLTALEINEDDSKIVKFYTYVKFKIRSFLDISLLDYRIEDEIDFTPQRGRGKKNKTTRKKKGSGQKMSIPYYSTTPPSTPSRSNNSPPRAEKMQRTPTKLTKKKRTNPNDITLTEYFKELDRTRSESPPYPETHETLTFGGKRTKKRKPIKRTKKTKKTKRRKPIKRRK